VVVSVLGAGFEVLGMVRWEAGVGGCICFGEERRKKEEMGYGCKYT
jgi:hypothetical protein